MASSLQESRSKWTDIWFGKLAGFHGAVPGRCSQAVAMKEKNEQTGEITDLRVPKHELEYVQRLRLRMRRLGKQYNSAKAYVKWVKRFLSVLNVGNSTDLEALGQSGGWKKPGLTPCG